MSNDSEPIVVEETFDAPVDAVWGAVTDVEQMRQWYFGDIAAFDARVGFETEFNVHCNGRDFLHVWEVTEVVPAAKITYRWTYRGLGGESFVDFKLCEQHGQTTLRLTHRGGESFRQAALPEVIPEFERESGVQGWSYFIKGSLKEYLEKGSVESKQFPAYKT